MVLCGITGGKETCGEGAWVSGLGEVCGQFIYE